MNDNTLNILKREALLRLGIEWESAVDACETITDVETLLKLVLGRKGNVWGNDYVGKDVTGLRVIYYK